MTREEYEKLVENSLSFKELDPDLQEKVLRAEGVEMEKYIKMFEDEARLLAQAYKNFQTETDAVIVGYKADVNKDQKGKLNEKERASKDKEIKNAEDLLNKI